MLGISSHLYPLAVADLLALPSAPTDATPADLPADDVILCIQKGAPDTLLRGRSFLLSLQSAGRAYVMTRLVFRPTLAPWRLASILIRSLRNLHRFRSSNIYHTSAAAIRALAVERATRSLANPQPRKNRDRAASMQRLAASLRANGFRDDRPIAIMLCRSFGTRDSLRQGHHRIAACVELGVDRIATSFDAAGFAPWGRRLQQCNNLPNSVADFAAVLFRRRVASVRRLKSAPAPQFCVTFADSSRALAAIHPSRDELFPRQLFLREFSGSFLHFYAWQDAFAAPPRP